MVPHIAWLLVGFRSARFSEQISSCFFNVWFRSARRKTGQLLAFSGVVSDQLAYQSRSARYVFQFGFRSARCSEQISSLTFTDQLRCVHGSRNDCSMIFLAKKSSKPIYEFIDTVTKHLGMRDVPSPDCVHGVCLCL